MVYFWHEASGTRHAAWSYDAATVELATLAREFHFDQDSLKLKHEASGDFIGVPTSGIVRLDMLRQHFAGEGSEEQPFVVDGGRAVPQNPRQRSAVTELASTEDAGWCSWQAKDGAAGRHWVSWC